jgi:muramidase (phage lysozyme)
MRNFLILFLVLYALKNADIKLEEEDQTGSILDYVPNDLEDLKNTVQDQFNEIDEQIKMMNLDAFLYMLRCAEGTAGNAGYSALFGYTPANNKVFRSFASHPAIFFDYTDRSGKTIKTSAAGAYQITFTTFKNLCSKYGFNDFSPSTQDQMAICLIKEKNALGDIEAGRVEAACQKLRKVWASLPNSDVSQPTRTINYLLSAYRNAGGVIA